MAQGCNKMGQKGTNAMFVMTQEKIRHALVAKKYFTYANPVVDYQPQKDNPHCIRIMARSYLITHDGDVFIRMADLDTAKLHWNSVISTKGAKYMCLNIFFFISQRCSNTSSTCASSCRYSPRG
jgi:hypothetical protein